MQEAIQAAYQRIRPWVRETPLERSGNVYLKLEHLQHTGSFKFRGASNKIAMLTPEQASQGVIAASNGNHGMGVAAAAQMRGIAAEVYVSTHVAPAKAERIKSLGATIRYAGADPLTAELNARQAADKAGKVFISPYNDFDVMAGQGTIAIELERQLPSIDAVFIAVGGGGLIGGIGSYFKAVKPDVEIVGCWPETSPVMYECMRAGKVVDVAEEPTISESTAGGLEPGAVTLDVCRRVIDRSVMVSEDEILGSMRELLHTEHWIVEGAAGVALAAYKKEAERYEGKNAVVLLCGRNCSPGVMKRLVV